MSLAITSSADLKVAYVIGMSPSTYDRDHIGFPDNDVQHVLGPSDDRMDRCTRSSPCCGD